MTKQIKKNMIKLSVPCIFDNSLLSFYQSFNEKYSHKGVKISNVYGALPGLYSAREKDRFPYLNQRQLYNYAKKLYDIGIDFTYTMNTVDVNLNVIRQKLAPFLKTLYNNGITSMTISSPLLVEYIKREMTSFKFHITLSTIASVDSISKLKQAINLGCNNIVLSLRANRDINFLSSICKLKKSIAIDICLIVNEFCGDCLIRPFHYIWESCSPKRNLNSNNPFFKFYPYSVCEPLWLSHFPNILKTYWILPQWLDYFHSEMGISHFKISGRSHYEPDWHKFVIKQYGNKIYNGNILRLAPHDTCSSLFNIDSKLLDKVEYFKYFTSQKPNCTSICGIECNFCEISAQKLFKLFAKEKHLV